MPFTAVKFSRETLVALLIGIFSLLPSLANSAERVLILGDSHTVGYFGQNLAALLRVDHKVAVVAASGASTYSYLDAESSASQGLCYSTQNGLIWTDYEGKIIDRSTNQSDTKWAPCLDSINNPTPDVIVVALGSNQIYFSEPDIKKHLTDFMDKIPGDARCYWVGPPSMRKIPESLILKFYEVLAKTSAGNRCTVFNSLDPVVTKYDPEKGDGIHYWNRQEAYHWAKLAFDCIDGIPSPQCHQPASNP